MSKTSTSKQTKTEATVGDVPGEAPKKAKSRPTKIQAVVALLSRPEGARIEEIMAATGWQAHSVRGAMSGALKKGLGLTIESEKTESGRVYRIPSEPSA